MQGKSGNTTQQSVKQTHGTSCLLECTSYSFAPSLY
jgi:hypothetical protein